MTTAPDISLPRWKIDRTSRPHIVASATQMETYDLCPRKWWLERVRKLQVASSTQSQIIGTVTHAVAERFLRADDTGRDTNGIAVDLFPADWTTAASRFSKEPDGTINPVEAARVQQLIATAIESGVLERHPGRQVEYEFRLTAIDGVSIMGFIDVLYPNRVEDHKTTSNMKWAKSPAALRESIQMMLYAKACLEETKKKGQPLAGDITLRHNVFCLDPQDLRVRKTEATVTVAEVEAFWRNRIRPIAAGMAQIKGLTEHWHEIPDPQSGNRACTSYGGCPFRSICSGVESPEEYERRVAFLGKIDILAMKPAADPPQLTSKGHQMTAAPNPLAAKLAAKKALNSQAPASPPATTPAAPAATVAPNGLVFKPKPVPVAAASAPAQTAPAAPKAPDAPAPAAAWGDTPPWAEKGCTACGGVGFNKEGQPCRICVLKAQKAGRPMPDLFEVEYPGDGTSVWMGKAGTAAEGKEGQTRFAALPAVKEEAKVEVKPAEPAPAPVVETKPAPAAPAPAAVEEESEGAGKQGRGRPKKTFMLVTNAGIDGYAAGTTGNDRGMIRLDRVLADLQAKLVEEMKAKGTAVESFFDINAFDRRDWLTKQGPSLVEGFGLSFVVADGIGTGASDLKALWEGILPFASTRIRGNF